MKSRKPGRPAKVPIERPADPAYLTIDEFCAMFAISRRSWPRHRPNLKTIHFGGRTLIEREDLRRYVDSLTRPAERPALAPVPLARR